MSALPSADNKGHVPIFSDSSDSHRSSDWMADRLSAPLPSGRRASESNESGIVGWHSSVCPVRLDLPRGGFPGGVSRLPGPDGFLCPHFSQESGNLILLSTTAVSAEFDETMITLLVGLRSDPATRRRRRYPPAWHQ